jgi:hypothetical protein
MFDKSILEKVQTYMPSSTEPSKPPLDLVFSAEDKYYTLATIGERSSTYPVLLFNATPQTTQALGKLAADLAALNLGIPFILSRADAQSEECIAVPSFDAVLNLLKAQKFEEPIALIKDDGTVHSARLYEFYRLCTRPWRISGGCEECTRTDNADTPGEPCPIKAAEESSEDLSDIDVDDLRETLEKAKHPRVGEYAWVSPIYTKTETTNTNRWGWRKRSPAAFQPYIRDIAAHDFAEIDDLRDRQSRAAKTKAKCQRLIKQVCVNCSFKGACDTFHAYQSKRYVAYCTSKTNVKSEQLIEAYAKQYRDAPKEAMAYVLKNVGPLPWRSGSYKLFMSVDLCAENTRIYIKYKTRPRMTAHSFKTFLDAAEYLQKHDKDKNLLQLGEDTRISDTTLALYEMACQYHSSPQRTSGWHSTSYSTRYIEPRYEGVRVVFSDSSGKNELHWSLDMDDIFDGFRYYGRQYLPHLLLREESD